jgi:hypothetical protein
LRKLERIAGVIGVTLLGLCLFAFGIGCVWLVFVSDFPWYGDLITLAFGVGVGGGGAVILILMIGGIRDGTY